MNADQREIFRSALLRVLEANHTQFGLTALSLAIHVGAYGFPGQGEDVVRVEVQYLEDKGFAAPVHKNISPENRAWRITATGRDELAQRG